MTVVIYRYELPDGDGPFFTKDGSNRIYSEVQFEDDTLSGCGNMTILDEWFRKRNISTEGLIVRKYIGEFLHQSQTGEIIIRKSSAQKLIFDF